MIKYILPIVFLFPMTARANMLPTASEKLANPLTMTDCPRVIIVEWRASKGYENRTKYSKKALTALNDTCKKVLDQFPKFVKSKKLKFSTVNGKFSHKVSIIPGQKQFQGSEPRNLNDLTGRFKNRYSEYDADGNPYPIFGYTSFVLKHTFLRNDLLTANEDVDSKVQSIWAHELYHALSYHFKVYENLGDDAAQEDEKLADKFTDFIGM